MWDFSECVIVIVIVIDLWDLIVAVLGNTNQSNKEQGDLLMNKREVRSPPHTIQKRKQSHGVINNLYNVDFLPSIVNSSHQEALLYVFEDNEAVIKMIIKGRSPTMRHVSRTHKVALDSLAGLLGERQFENILFEVRLGEGFQLGTLIRTP